MTQSWPWDSEIAVKKLAPNDRERERAILLNIIYFVSFVVNLVELYHGSWFEAIEVILANTIFTVPLTISYH